MRNIEALVVWIEGKTHELKTGHWPVWFEMERWRKECMECVMKRSGGPKGGRQRNVWARRPNLLPVPL